MLKESLDQPMQPLMISTDSDSDPDPIPDDVETHQSHHCPWAPFATRTRRRKTHRVMRANANFSWVVCIPWVCFCLLAAFVMYQHRRRGPSNPIFPQILYSPAQDALEYEVRKFRLGLDGDVTEYQGPPSPELDKRWSDLYEMGINLVPRHMAEKLPNRTILFPHDEQRRYLIELDVFHQLHCLNMIRQALHPEYYKPHTPGPNPGDEDELLAHDHIDHCVDAIRQSLMCNADISVLTWTWDKKRGRNMEQGTVLHTCRRFDRIQEWARKHAIYYDMDAEFREPNDPLDPDTWVDGFSG